MTFGALITEGCSPTDDNPNRWPEILTRRLRRSGIGVLNEGIGSNRLLVDGSGLSVADRFERDVLDQPGFSYDPLTDRYRARPLRPHVATVNYRADDTSRLFSSR